ncbi:MAG: hypothetical protein WA996_00870 [Candidatus Promineifilaceae bacterium]
MAKDRENPKDWYEKGVRAFVPSQESKVDADIHEKDYESRPNQPHFTMVRELVNFEVVNANTGKPIGIFHPPLEITVCFIESDMATAQTRGKPLKLGAWINDRWWTLPTKHPPGECPHGNPEHMGAYKALITGKWDDPEIGWGT